MALSLWERRFSNERAAFPNAITKPSIQFKNGEAAPRTSGGQFWGANGQRKTKPWPTAYYCDMVCCNKGRISSWVRVINHSGWSCHHNLFTGRWLHQNFVLAFPGQKARLKPCKFSRAEKSQNTFKYIRSACDVPAALSVQVRRFQKQNAVNRAAVFLKIRAEIVEWCGFWMDIYIYIYTCLLYCPRWTRTSWSRIAPFEYPIYAWIFG